jgi:hypothetical protein
MKNWANEEAVSFDVQVMVLQTERRQIPNAMSRQFSKSVPIEALLVEHSLAEDNVTPSAVVIGS